MVKVLRVAVPLLVLGSLIGWRLHVQRGQAAAQQGQRAARGKAPASVVTAPVVVRDIVQVFEGVAGLESPQTVRIAPKTTGRVESLSLHEGDPVQVGQVVATIDAAEVAATVASRQAALSEAQARLAQAEISTASADSSVVTQVTQQQAAVASASADLAQVRANAEQQVAAAEASVADAQAKLDAATADVATAQAATQSAQANLDNARSKNRRATELLRQGFISAQAVDDATAAVAVQESAVAVAASALNAARSRRESAAALKRVAERQAQVTRNKTVADIAASQARQTQASAGLEQAQANRVQKPAYRANLNALRQSVLSARALLRSAQAQMGYTVLRSPLNGFVTARSVDPGAVVTPGQAVLTVQESRDLWATTYVPDEQVTGIRVGAPARVAVDAFPDRPFTGSVTQVNRAVDTQSRQSLVRVLVANPDGALRPGQFARVTLETGRIRNAVVARREAVQRARGGAFVSVAQPDGKAAKRPVTVGASDPEGVQILSGAKPGEQLVILSAMPVRDGQEVRTGPGKSGKRGGPRK